LRFGQPVDYALGVGQLQALKRERRACVVAQQPLQAGAIVRGDAGTAASIKNPLFCQASISRTLSRPISPLRANHRSTRTRTCPAIATTAAGVRAEAGRKASVVTTPHT